MSLLRWGRCNIIGPNQWAEGGIGSWVRGWNSENKSFAFESDRFSNGEHVIRLVSENLDGEIINYEPVNAYFDNTIYKISNGEHFHPDEDYRYSGYYDGAESLGVELIDLYDNVIWSNMYSGDYIDINIPGSAFGTEKYCELNITETTGGMMDTAQENGMAMASDSSGSVSKSLKKKFKREDCTGVRMLIITPTKDVFRRRKFALIACAKACDAQGVTWVPLYYHDVTEGNLTFLYNKDSVKYIYWAGHAGSHAGEVRRTHTECWRNSKIWVPDYEPGAKNIWKTYAFSFTGGLPDNWDYRGFDLFSLLMFDSWNKKIVFVDGCLSGLPYGNQVNDMAFAYGVFSEQGQGSKDQVYIGWRKAVYDVPSWHIVFKPVLKSSEGVKLFWEKMGDGMGVRDALIQTGAQYAGREIGEVLWGENAVPDFYQLEGKGTDNLLLWSICTTLKLNEIKLEP